MLKAPFCICIETIYLIIELHKVEYLNISLNGSCCIKINGLLIVCNIAKH